MYGEISMLVKVIATKDDGEMRQIVLREKSSSIPGYISNVDFSK